MRHIALALTLAVTGTTTNAAPQGTAVQVEQKHEKIFEKLDFLTVQFTQTSYRSLRKNTKVSNGVAYFAKPVSFRWDFQKNDEITEQYIFDGDTLSHYKKSDKLVTRYGKSNNFASDLKDVVNMILDAKNLTQKYDVKLLSEDKNATVAELTPKTKASGDIKLITLKLSEERKYIKSLKIDYNDGNYTQYEFKNPRFDSLPTSTFQFKNPGGVTEKKVG